MVASPSGYDPLTNREAAGKRRALVLQRMVEQGSSDRRSSARPRCSSRSRPAATSSRRPRTRAYPYFTSWVKQQVVDKLGGGQEGARKAFEGGLTVRTTLDVRLQEAAEQAVATSGCRGRRGRARRSWRSTTRPARCSRWSAATTTRTRPFNLATQGQRQPGSAFKPFVLAQALSDGVSPDSTWNSQKIDICVTRKKGKCIEYFDVNNYEDAYGGRPHAAHGDDVLRQLRLRAARRQGRHAQDRAARAPDRHPHAGVAQLRHDARRAQAGRDAARHGPRLPDVRARRPPHLEHDEPRRRRAQPARRPRARPGRHPR